MHCLKELIFQDDVYWSDWENHAIMMADKYRGQMAGPFISNLSRVTDIKVFHSASQQGITASFVKWLIKIIK